MAERRFALLGHTHAAGSGTVVMELSDLTDVNTSTPTALNFLVADGVDWESRALVETDIVDGSLLARVADQEVITGWWQFDSRVRILGGNELRIQDPTNLDRGTFAHDGVNFTLTCTNTADFNVLGVGEVGLGNYLFDVDQAVTVSEDNYVLTYDNADGQISLEALPSAAEVNDLSAAVTWANVPDANITQGSVTQHEAALTILESQITDANILARIAGNELITGAWQFEDNVEVFNTGGGGLRTSIGAGNKIEIYHTDASAVNTDLAFTSDVDAGATLFYNGETRLITGAWGVTAVYSTTSTDSETRRIEYRHQNGTIRAEIGYDINAPTAFLIENQIHGGLVKINAENAAGSAKNLFTGDPDGDSVMYHAGVATVTADSSGMTVAGDLTGTTIGGITTANLLDKTATEDVTGAYRFTNSAFAVTDIHRVSTTSAAAIKYSNTDGVKGYLGFNDSSQLQTWDSGSSSTGFSVDSSGLLRSSESLTTGVIEGGYMRSAVVTTTNLADITHVINTAAGKKLGAWVFNTTTSMPVWAAGDTDGAVWLDATGATAHTPV